MLRAIVRKPAKVQEGHGEPKGTTYCIDMFLQLLDGIVRDGGLPVDEEAVPDWASADGLGLCGPGRR